MAEVAGHLSLAELQAGYRASGDATLARHYQVIWLLAQGRSCAEVGQLTSFRAALGRAAAGPLQRLRTVEPRRPAAGNGAKPRLLTPEVLEALRERLKSLPDDGGVWTAKKAAAFMAAELGLAPGRRAARLGGAARDRLDPPTPAPAPCASRDPRRAGGVQKNLADVVAEEAERHPGAVIETFATDEHRIGLKPCLTPGLGAARPAPGRALPSPLRVALRHRLRLAGHRRELLVPLQRRRQGALRGYARALRARGRRGARPHHRPRARRRRLAHRARPWPVPEGVRLIHLPPYTPELQPAETLWVHVDEPIANRHFQTLADLDAAVAARCVALNRITKRSAAKPASTGGQSASSRTDQPEFV